ncbi:MAG: hypothetical protein ABIF71_06040 [Planctomycetota bacterium]
MKLSRPAATGILAVLLGGVVLIQFIIDQPEFERLHTKHKIKYERIDEGAHLLPAPAVLRAIVVGFNPLLAEFLMQGSYNYAYQYSFAGRNEGYLNRLYEGALALNPYHIPAYRNGGYFIYGPRKSRTNAAVYFRKAVATFTMPGLALDPAWQPDIYIRERLRNNNGFLAAVRRESEPPEVAVKFMVELAIHYFAYLKDVPTAADIYRCAQRVFPKYRDDLYESEIALRTEEGQFGLIIDRWRNYIEANRDNPRKVAEGLRQIMAGETSHLLSLHQTFLDGYFKGHAAYPADLAAFTRPEGRTDAFGLVFIYLPASGTVLSRAMLREEFKGHWVALRRAITAWHDREGAYPPDLEALKVLPPRYPLTVTFPYDPATGTVDLPDGYGDDPAALLVLLVSAALRSAVAGGDVLPAGPPSDAWAVSLPDDTRRQCLDLWAQYADWEFSVLAGAPSLALAMRSASGATLMADGSGRVWRGTTLVMPLTWPAIMAGWEQVVE